MCEFPWPPYPTVPTPLWVGVWVCVGGCGWVCVWGCVGELSPPLFPPVFPLTQMYVSASFYTLKGGGDPCRSSWEKARKHPPPSKMVGFPDRLVATPQPLNFGRRLRCGALAGFFRWEPAPRVG